MYEPLIRPLPMNNQQRSQFVQKAKSDRLAYDAAQLLSLGETEKAATLANESMTLAGREQFSIWLHHYATTRFKIASGTVRDFLSSVSPATVAL